MSSASLELKKPFGEKIQKSNFGRLKCLIEETFSIKGRIIYDDIRCFRDSCVPVLPSPDLSLNYVEFVLSKHLLNKLLQGIFLYIFF